MDNVNKQTVGQRIKNIRLSRGNTLEEFGKEFNTSKVTVYNWEIGRNLPNKENLKAIADLAGITVEELLHGEKQESTGPKNDKKKLYDRLESRINDGKKDIAQDKYKDLPSSIQSEYYKDIEDCIKIYRSYQKLIEKPQYAFYIYEGRLYLMTAVNDLKSDDYKLSMGVFETIQVEAFDESTGQKHLVLEEPITSSEQVVRIIKENWRPDRDIMFTWIKTLIPWALCNDIDRKQILEYN